MKAWVDERRNPLRPDWVDAIRNADIPAVRRLLHSYPAFANSAHPEFDDPWRTKKFPTATLDYVAAGPLPQTRECRAWNDTRPADRELLRLLLNSGATPDTDTHHGSCICWIRDPAVAALLIEHGAPINRWYTNGGSPLNFTCWSFDPERTELLLALGADPNVADPVTRETCLHTAADVGAISCVCLLLEAGADPNARCVANPNLTNYLVQKRLPDTPLVAETPLHRAALMGNQECMRALLKGGADHTLETADGDRAQDWRFRDERSF